MSFDTIQQMQILVGELELYELVFIDHVEYYNTGSKDITFPVGHAFNPLDTALTFLSLPLIRDDVKSQQKLLGKKTRIILPLRSAAFQDTLIAGGLGRIGVRIIRGFGNPVTNPENFSRYWFIGEVQDIQTGQNVLMANVQSQEYLFDLIEIPRPTIGRTCMHGLYDEFCALPETAFTYDFTVLEVLKNFTKFRIDPDNAVTSKFDLGDGVDVVGHYTLGKVWKLDDPVPVKSMILMHEFVDGDAFCTISTHTPLPLVSATPPNNRVKVSWGCAKRIKEDCIPKFNNKLNAVAMPTLPNVNPTIVVLFNKP